MTLLGPRGDGGSSRQTWMCGQPTSDRPPDPRHSKQNEHLENEPGKGAALSLETIRRDELSLTDAMGGCGAGNCCSLCCPVAP